MSAMVGSCWEKQERTDKSSNETKPVSKKTVGRPKTRWENLVWKDLELHGEYSDWKKKTLYGEDWRLGCEMGWLSVA